MKKKAKINDGQGRVHFRTREEILYCQRRLADYLNTKSRNLSRKAMLTLLIIFIVLTSIALLRLIINAIH